MLFCIRVTTLIVYILMYGALLVAQESLIPGEDVRANSQHLITGQFSSRGEIKLYRAGGRNVQRDLMSRLLESQSLVSASAMHSPPELFQSLPTPMSSRREDALCVFDYSSMSLYLERKVDEQGERSSKDTFWVIFSPDAKTLGRTFDKDKINLSINPSSYATDDIPLHFGTQFNGRTMGWGGTETLRYAFTTDNFSNFPTGQSATGSKQIFRESNTSDGLTKIEYVTLYNEKTPPRIRTWWCDSSCGGQPIKYTDETRFLEAKTPVEELYNRGAYPRVNMSATWKSISGVWVIESLFIVEKRSDIIQDHRYSFDWAMVNLPVEKSRFSWKSIPLTPNSEVFDMRMGEDKPVLIESVGSVVEAEIPPVSKSPNSVSQKSSLYAINMGFLIAAFVVVMGLVIRRSF
jgi:hypothetical protein